MVPHISWQKKERKPKVSFECLPHTSCSQCAVVVTPATLLFVSSKAMTNIRSYCDVSGPRGLERRRVGNLSVPLKEVLVAKSIHPGEYENDVPYLQTFISAVHLGNAEGALEAAITCSGERYQTGCPVIEHQGVRKNWWRRKCFPMQQRVLFIALV